MPSLATPKLKNSAIFVWFAAAWLLKSKVNSTHVPTCVTSTGGDSYAVEVPPSSLATTGPATGTRTLMPSRFLDDRSIAEPKSMIVAANASAAVGTNCPTLSLVFAPLLSGLSTIVTSDTVRCC